MKQPNRLTQILIVSLIAVTIGYLILRPSEEDKIRERLEELTQTLSTPPQNGLLGKAQVISSFQNLLANPVFLDSPTPHLQGVKSPRALALAYITLTQTGQQPTIEFKSLSIDILSENRAILKATATGSLIKNTTPTQSFSTPIEIELNKSNNTWTFTKFTIQR
tara:strand:+ start:40807 stop:41298 length:492 start_codon:yes stop_codon:yes gene_type:complete